MLPRFESWEVDNELLRRYDINKKQFGVMLNETNSDCIPMSVVPNVRHAAACGATCEGKGVAGIAYDARS